MECDRCDFSVTAESTKSFLGGYKMAPYPETWKQIETDTLCPKCTKDFYAHYKDFMQKGRNKTRR